MLIEGVNAAIPPVIQILSALDLLNSNVLWNFRFEEAGTLRDDVCVRVCVCNPAFRRLRVEDSKLGSGLKHKRSCHKNSEINKTSAQEMERRGDGG